MKNITIEQNNNFEEMSTIKVRLLFVCMGNICRSPAAQAVMQRLVDERGLSDCFEIDSAGTIDYHEGELADARMRRAAARRGLELTHRSRPVRPERDFDYFDHIIVMDEANLSWFASRMTAMECAAKVIHLGHYIRHEYGGRRYDVVPDPYYGGPADFELALDLLEDACPALLDALLALHR